MLNENNILFANDTDLNVNRLRLFPYTHFASNTTKGFYCSLLTFDFLEM